MIRVCTLWPHCLSSSTAMIVHGLWRMCRHVYGHYIFLLNSWMVDQCLLQVGLKSGLCIVNVSLIWSMERGLDTWELWDIAFNVRTCIFRAEGKCQNSWKHCSWKTWKNLLHSTVSSPTHWRDIKLGWRAPWKPCQIPAEPLFELLTKNEHVGGQPHPTCPNSIWSDVYCCERNVGKVWGVWNESSLSFSVPAFSQ